MRSRLHPLPSLVIRTLLLFVASSLLPIVISLNSKALASPLDLFYSTPNTNMSPMNEINILHDGNEATIDRKVAVAQLLQKGIQQYRSRQYQEALKTYQQVLAIRRELGDKAGVASALHNIGTIYYHLGQTKQSLNFLTEALAIRREIGDEAGVARTLSNIKKIDPNYNIGENNPNVDIVRTHHNRSGQVSLLFEDDEKQATPPRSSAGQRDIIPAPPRPSSPSSNRNTVPSAPANVAQPSGDRDTIPGRI